MKKTHRKHTKKEIKLIYDVAMYVAQILGEQFMFRWHKQKKLLKVVTGMRWYNQEVFTCGDCARFAKLLYDKFIRRKPQVVLIRYANTEKDKNNFYNWDHALCKIGDWYFDAYGYYSETYVKYWSDYIGPMIIRNMNSKIFNGNFNGMGIDITAYRELIPYHDFLVDYSDQSNIKIEGHSGGGLIAAANRLFTHGIKHLSPEDTTKRLDRYMHRDKMSFNPMPHTGHAFLWNRIIM